MPLLHSVASSLSDRVALLLLGGRALLLVDGGALLLLLGGALLLIAGPALVLTLGLREALGADPGERAGLVMVWIFENSLLGWGADEAAALVRLGEGVGDRDGRREEAESQEGHLDIYTLS